MKIRRDMIFAVLTTFCMCALMFAVVPIRSGLPYDPWADIDGNGKIDMKDIGNVAAQFMTSGDPTKNVNVTNWPTTPLHNYTGVEEYTVVDVSRMVAGTEYGMYIISGSGPFAFSPKQSFITVTNRNSASLSHMSQVCFLGLSLFHDLD